MNVLIVLSLVSVVNGGLALIGSRKETDNKLRECAVYGLTLACAFAAMFIPIVAILVVMGL